jgi:hypothetical protein
MLYFAEKLQEKCDQKERLSNVLMAVVGAAGALQIAIVARVTQEHTRASDVLAIVLGIGFAISFGFLVLAYRHAISELRRDSRALFRMVAIMRETELAFAMQELFTTLETEEFRIKLSRFGIGRVEDFASRSGEL